MLRRAPPWRDPDVRRTIETDVCRHVPPADPTNEPNRLTIWVPTETTYLNLGQAFPSVHERGIDGHTDRHIHFYTPKTTVMMGKDCQLLPHHVGYSMVTSENAYQHADLQNCYVSKTNQIALRTAGAMGGEGVGNGNAVLQSDSGTTEIAAGESVAITAENTVYISAGCGYSPCTNTYDQPWVNATRDGSLSSHTSTAATYAYCGQVALVTIGGFTSSIRQCVTGTSKWLPETMQAVPKAAAAYLNIAACMAALGDSPDSIRMTADSGVVFGAAKSIMFGEILSCMTTLGGASIVAPTAELKAWALATVWGGVTATMASKKVCKISSPLGKVVFDATTTASFASHGEMLVFGHDQVSMRADGTAALYGGKQAYVGSGGGFGLFADGKSVAFGKMNDAKSFGHPGLDEKHALLVKKGTVHLRHGDDPMLHVSDRKTTILKRNNKNFVKVSSKGVLVKGDEIHIE